MKNIEDTKALLSAYQSGIESVSDVFRELIKYEYKVDNDAIICILTEIERRNKDFNKSIFNSIHKNDEYYENLYSFAVKSIEYKRASLNLDDTLEHLKCAKHFLLKSRRKIENFFTEIISGVLRFAFWFFVIGIVYTILQKLNILPH